jgi:hypothetical protein
VQKCIIERLSSAEVQNFILSHEKDDENVLVLKHKNLFDLPTSLIANQIAGRAKARTKLPEFYRTPDIIYPPLKNLEQASSQKTALYKSEEIGRQAKDTRTVVDLTGGFGVDSYYLSKVFLSVIYVEPDSSLLEIAKHNHKKLNAFNIRHHSGTAEDFLSKRKEQVSAIFIDPSRRISGNRKISSLRDSEPDVTLLLNTIFEVTPILMIKAAPLLDITAGVHALRNVHNIVVLSVDNDCKELLFFLKPDHPDELDIKAVNLTNRGQETFDFTISEERAAETKITLPENLIYEPNVSILKAGAFKCVANRFGLQKLDPNTHLYTSSEMKLEFPGRVFEVKQIIKSNIKSAREFFPEGKANILVRNYPSSVEDLKKKLKLKEGGEKYLIAARADGEKLLLAAARIK